MVMLLMMQILEEVFSINALWKNKVAVLVGDFYLVYLAVKNKQYKLLEIVNMFKI